MKKTFFLLGLAGILLTSCNKKSPEPATPDSDVTTAKDAVKSYEVTNDVFLMVALTRDTYTFTPFFGSTGVTIVSDTVAKIDTLILNNAQGTDGNIRNGKVVIKYAASTLNAKYIRQPGFKCTVELYNYTINTTSVSATSIQISNTTPNGFNPNTTSLTWAATFNNFTMNDGTKSVVFSTTQNIKLLNTNSSNVYNSTGNLPIQWNKAKISVIGNATGSNSNGSFEVTFNSPSTDYLYRNLSDMDGCAPEGFLKPGKRPFIQGLIYLKPNGKNTQVVNLGNGTCDYNINVTIDGITYQTDVL
ncbi:MAG: hypothetical protein KatS3mg027_1238 [Bacteroidia bacterium]|nr:MAG: hypothetical protein KatS3mg027_1238 [Bacteroidia bacterium]